MTTSEDFLLPGNAKLDGQTKHLSPSGKYELTVTPYTTKKGCWNYTLGVVTLVSSGKTIEAIRRNYSSFPFCWVEGHPNGKDYLLGGENYQGQTVLELSTGERLDYLPPEAEQGHGFCWAEIRFHPETKMLIVNGCHWACPYEFRFYDFSDPMAGWPEIVSDGIYEDQKPPEIDADGVTIKCFETTSEDDEEEGDDRTLASTRTFKREGLKLTQVDEWVSDAEKKRRADREESNRKYEAWQANFKATDPLYLAYKELVRDPELSPDDYESVGITHNEWCPDFKGDEQRWCRRILKTEKITVDLEWAVLTGPIKLVIYTGGKFTDNKFFPHSVEAMHEAFAYAKKAASQGLVGALLRKVGLA